MTQKASINLGAYRLAYERLLALSSHLDRGTIHLRDRDGLLLEKLDQILVAVEAGRWPPPVACPAVGTQAELNDERRT
jgi:hypothetical protein